MCITTGNNTCDAMAKLHLCGNIIPQIWHKTIVSEKTGKADLIAINILADIAYWYRPAEERDELTGETVGYHPKFAADILQRSYDDLAEHFGISKGQAKCAVIRLEQLGVVRRVFRKISVGGISIPNVLFLALNVDRLRELTYRHRFRSQPLPQTACVLCRVHGCAPLFPPTPFGRHWGVRRSSRPE